MNAEQRIVRGWPARPRRFPRAGHGFGQRRLRGQRPLPGARGRRQLGQTTAGRMNRATRIPPAPRAGGRPCRGGGRSRIRSRHPAPAVALGGHHTGIRRTTSRRRTRPNAADAEHPRRHHQRTGRSVWPWLPSWARDEAEWTAMTCSRAPRASESAARTGSCPNTSGSTSAISSRWVPTSESRSGASRPDPCWPSAGTFGSTHREDQLPRRCHRGTAAGTRLDVCPAARRRPHHPAAVPHAVRLFAVGRGTDPPAGAGAGAVHHGTAHAAGHQVPGRGPRPIARRRWPSHTGRAADGP